MVVISDKESTSYKDWVLLPQYSEVHPSEVDISSRLSKNILLKLPVVSSPMDTVTESDMAIAMALHGGIGVIHKYLTIPEQVREVEKAKRFRSGVIDRPYVISPQQTLRDLELLIQTTGKSRFPVTENGQPDGKLVGMITDKDAIDYNIEQVQTHMTPFSELVVSRSTEKEETRRLLLEKRKEVVPLVDDDNNLRGIITFSDIRKSKEYPYASKDAKERLIVGAAVGVNDLDRVKALADAYADVIVVDASHGDTKNVISTVEAIKGSYKFDVIAGNVVTKQGVEHLAEAGADGIRVGIGVGASCTTHVTVGHGRGQATAVMECAIAAEAYEVPIIADGSIKETGQASLALAMGASAVMLGGMLAFTEEAACPPDRQKFKRGDVWYKTYRGMGSSSALARGLQVNSSRYAQAKMIENKYSPEGIETEGRIIGPVVMFLDELRAAISKATSGQGARDIEELWAKAVIERVSPNAAADALPAYRPSKDEPNYSTSR